MARRNRLWWLSSELLGLGLALAVIAAAWSATGFVWERRPAPVVDNIETVVVHRDDLDTTILVGGDLTPTRQTRISCQVEDIVDPEGTVVLSVIANGKLVKKGDELCRLDASQYEALVREEEIAVEQVRADCRRAELVLETARIAFREYNEGLALQLTKEFEGRLALHEADSRRQADRVTWTEAMLKKGYLSRGQLLTERQTLARLLHELRKAQGEFKVFRQFQIPTQVKSLQAEILKAANNHHLESDRLKSEVDHLAFLRKQVENCTIRAPHDGVVVYVLGSQWRPQPIEPGTPIYQNQDMFMIPDLTQMEVEIAIHETEAPRVRPGMKASVRVASMPGGLPARVVDIAMLPAPHWKVWDEKLRHFITHVRLDRMAENLLPFMSASVTIDTGRVKDALVIPAEAMAMVDGRQSCYVVSSGGLERRAIRTRNATIDLVEVTAGLEEGERVVARSADVRGLPLDQRPREPKSDLARGQTASPARTQPSVRPS